MTTAPDEKEYYTLDDLPWLQDEIKRLSFGRILRAHRKGLGMSAKAAALKLGFSPQLLSEYETGKSLPSLSKAIEMADALALDREDALHYLLKDQLKQAGIHGFTVTVKAS
jgi:transcriptional regulator with XRE-family HTH domain